MEFSYEDEVFELAPKELHSKLNRIKPVPLLVYPDALDGADAQIRQEMHSQWQKDSVDL